MGNPADAAATNASFAKVCVRHNTAIGHKTHPYGPFLYLFWFRNPFPKGVGSY